MVVGCVAKCVEESRKKEKERRQKVKGWLLWLRKNGRKKKKKQNKREMGWVGCGGEPINIIKE